MKKILMAELILRFMEEEGGSRALAETKAVAAAEYKEHITRMVEARREANRARVEFDVSLPDLTHGEVVSERDRGSSERAERE